MEENNAQAESLNQAEEVVLDTTSEATDTNETVDVEEIKSKLSKAEELANNYKIRAEKAEKLAKTTQKVENKSDISTSDVIALVKANVAEEDIKEVQDFAKFKNISVSEALKLSTIKTLLAEKDELRKTANATNVANAKRSPAKVSSETLLNRAVKGEMPESEEDIVTIIKARKGIK